MGDGSTVLVWKRFTFRFIRERRWRNISRVPASTPRHAGVGYRDDLLRGSSPATDQRSLSFPVRPLRPAPVRSRLQALLIILSDGLLSAFHSMATRQSSQCLPWHSGTSTRRPARRKLSPWPRACQPSEATTWIAIWFCVWPSQDRLRGWGLLASLVLPGGTSRTPGGHSLLSRISTAGKLAPRSGKGANFFIGVTRPAPEGMFQLEFRALSTSDHLSGSGTRAVTPITMRETSGSVSRSLNTVSRVRDTVILGDLNMDPVRECHG